MSMEERTVKTKHFYVHETHVHHSLCSTIELFSNVDVHQQADRFKCKQSFPSLIINNFVITLLNNSNFLGGMGFSNNSISQMDENTILLNGWKGISNSNLHFYQTKKSAWKNNSKLEFLLRALNSTNVNGIWFELLVWIFEIWFKFLFLFGYWYISKLLCKYKQIFFGCKWRNHLKSVHYWYIAM